MSLDRDLKRLRLGKFTPAAANEARAWIEGILGQRLSGDLLESLKDGVALCKLINLAVPPPGVKFKTSAMPFVQMENISHFLRACKAPPLNLQEHDMFLTVDLFEAKDPAQVLQCLGAFSRAANKANPSSFPTAIGPRAAGLSPQRTGAGGTLSPTPTPGSRPRGMSNSSNASSAYGGRPPLVAAKTGDSTSGRWSPAKSPTANGPKSPSVSSWSSKANEGATSPAWNIAQYGYMGGASQANLGISFGGRRQITSAGPSVPSLAEKEKRRKAKEAEEQKQRDEEVARRQAELEAEEHAKREEARRWEEETRRLREVEQRRAAEEKRRWEDEERQWKITEEKRRKEEEEAEKRLAQERSKGRRKSGDSRLQGQFLSQYQAEQTGGGDESYSNRIKELEKELELARERESHYERERQDRVRVKSGDAKSRARSRSRPRPASGEPTRQDSWAHGDERSALPQSRNEYTLPGSPLAQRPQPPPRQHSRPLPDPAVAAAPPAAMVKTHRTGESARSGGTRSRANTASSRPLPDPKAYSSPSTTPSPQMNRTDRYLASNSPAAPAPPAQQLTYARELGGGTEERDAEDRRRAQTQQRTKAGHMASKSLLEREMEMERQRQREWEESQKETAKAPRGPDGVDGIGGGIGGRWDVSQFAGYTGGDNLNRGTQGIGAGRRQIGGPRPLPGTPGSTR
ncbi:calponin [Diaporthe australafricana]|uniref:Calponin n=1 Tax=Diaporthe australafricana TaxID=127596 RepID=A0ABR3XHX3_9PEZI